MNEVDDLSNYPHIIIESDNCRNQYESCSHFYGMQKLADEYKIPLIRVWCIADHGKGDMDHVGGVAKTQLGGR